MADRFKRQTGGWGGNKRILAAEDGKVYRGVSTDMAPVLKHVREQDEAFNAAPEKNGMGMRYAGSIPFVMLEEWCNQQGVGIDQWARDEALKAKFMAWFNSPEFRALQAKNFKGNRFDYGGRDQQPSATDSDS